MSYLDSFESYLLYELNRSKLTVTAYLGDLVQFAEWLCGDKPCGKYEGQSKKDKDKDKESGNDTNIGIYSYKGHRLPDDFDPTQVTTSDVRAWVMTLADAGDTPRTLRRKVQSLRAYFRYLRRQGVVNVNPTRDIILAKLDKTLPKFVRTDEMEALLSEEQGEGDGSVADFELMRNHLIVELLYTTGMRRAEIIGLRDCDIDTYRREVKITGKRDKQRLVPLLDTVLDHIAAYRALRDKLYGSRGPQGALLIHRGKPVTPYLIHKVVSQALAATSSEKKSPHVLRHTFATSMLNNGADINCVKELLGHSSLTPTQIYTHVSFAEMKRSYEASHPRARRPGTGKTEE